MATAALTPQQQWKPPAGCNLRMVVFRENLEAPFPGP